LTGIAPGDVPARGKRPRNRRDIIITAAAELFAAEGFANVSMSDIAAAVNVQPSALYRHFSGKNEILREAISRGARLRQEAVALGEPVDLEETLLDMAHMALETRRASVLWTTEVRNLDDETRRDLRREMRALPAAFTERLTSVRSELGPRHVELLAWAALDVLASISFHGSAFPTGSSSRCCGTRCSASSCSSSPQVPTRFLTTCYPSCGPYVATRCSGQRRGSSATAVTTR
jgi:AcrR family transcriptional regulator